MRTFSPQNRRPAGTATTATSAPRISLQDDQSFSKANRFDFDFSQIPIYPAAPLAAHTRLAIGALSDRSEQEADRIAGQVGMNSSSTNDATPLARFQHGSGVSTETAVPPAVTDSLRSPGRPLAPEVRAFMEPRFGCDFSRVRVHADDKAAESARALHARAYTVGHDLVFAAGQYAPDDSAGKVLLAHELTHVVQQKREPAIRLRIHPWQMAAIAWRAIARSPQDPMSVS